QGNN
ncbi:polysaccharide biosynthesis family protein, partial [Vibrio parahaemolyticus EKP-028]